MARADSAAWPALRVGPGRRLERPPSSWPQPGNDSHFWMKLTRDADQHHGLTVTARGWRTLTAGHAEWPPSELPGAVVTRPLPPGWSLERVACSGVAPGSRPLPWCPVRMSAAGDM